MDTQTLPTVNTNALLLTVSRLSSRLRTIEDTKRTVVEELENAQQRYSAAMTELEGGAAKSGSSHARFDTQEQRWTITPTMFRTKMQGSMRKLLFTVFQISAPPTEDISLMLTGAEVRKRIEMHLPTRSPVPLRMFHLYRSELIRRDILRLV